jgi:rhamnopyranosyl-N-acetylglucosaminyl-diphospho-decaprenol beta-1,3/1,4-galactofuranosyltransferase
VGCNFARIVAVVVTYNRAALLERCIHALFKQHFIPSGIVIIDNASTDDTHVVLKRLTSDAAVQIQVVQLNDNGGGAGGFCIGLGAALNLEADWVWMMDDDAEPHPNALQELMEVAVDPGVVYGSLAVCKDETSWLTTVIEPPLGEISIAGQIPDAAVVQSIPFLGFLIHRDLVARIGLPDAGFFIAADDVEYCIRAQRAGAKVVIAGKSRIEHPKSRPYKVRILGRNLTCLALPPWKRYYDTRNRLLIARRHFGVKLLTQTIPGSFVRLFAALIKEPRRLAQSYAWFAGMIDGLLGIKGRRHEWWRIGT